jgi:hypothetical protein
MLQNDTHSIELPRQTDPLSVFVSELKRTRSKKSLKLHQDRLQFLAQNFDPFKGEPISECQRILEFYGLEETLVNPFYYTNLLLQMLDQLEFRSKALN